MIMAPRWPATSAIPRFICTTTPGYIFPSTDAPSRSCSTSLLAQWPTPVEELVIIGHSMGGLVARSAYHYGAVAGHDWPRRLDKLIFLGAPHHGAPLERGGQWVDLTLGKSPYTAPFTRFGRIRSAGVTDLRYGNLLDEDWEGRDRFEHTGDARQAVPLPASVCSASPSPRRPASGSATFVTGSSATGFVPLNSALGRHKEPHLALSFAAHRQWIGYAMNHLDLLGRQEVYEQIRNWLSPGGERCQRGSNLRGFRGPSRRR